MPVAGVAKLVHILCMFGAFALLLAPLVVLAHLARRGDAPAVGAVLRARKALGGVTGVLFLTGLVAGVVTQRAVGWSDLSPWLVATYGLIVLYGVWERVVPRPWERAVEQTFAGAEGRDKEALPALLRSRRPALGAWGGAAIVACIEAMMVLKPSFGF
jgi:hypothetical protein